MLITNPGSSQLLLDSLCVSDADGKPIKKVKQLDTETKQATLQNDSVVTCAEFWFFVAFSDLEATQALVPEELHYRICPGKKTAYNGKHMQSMLTVEVNSLVATCLLRPAMFTCSACGANFLVFLGKDSAYTAAKSSTSDVLQTATLIDVETFTCDNCGIQLDVNLP